MLLLFLISWCVWTDPLTNQLVVSSTLISATPGLLSSTSSSAASARSAKTAKLSRVALSGWVAKWALMETGICRMNACRITAFPTTALVPKPAVFCRRRRKGEGMSFPIFSPEIPLLTLSGVVNPLLSIKIAFRLSYLLDLKGWSSTSLTSDAISPESAAQVKLYLSSSSSIWWRANWVSIWLNQSSTSEA